MNLKTTIEPVFKDCSITIPYIKPLVLKAKMINNAPAFVFILEDIEYYIFVDASSYIWKDTLPKYLSENSRKTIIDAVTEYVFKTKQGFLPQTIFNGCKEVN